MSYIIFFHFIRCHMQPAQTIVRKFLHCLRLISSTLTASCLTNTPWWRWPTCAHGIEWVEIFLKAVRFYLALCWTLRVLFHTFVYMCGTCLCSTSCHKTFLICCRPSQWLCTTVCTLRERHLSNMSPWRSRLSPGTLSLPLPLPNPVVVRHTGHQHLTNRLTSNHQSSSLTSVIERPASQCLGCLHCRTSATWSTSSQSKKRPTAVRRSEIWRTSDVASPFLFLWKGRLIWLLKRTMMVIETITLPLLCTQRKERRQFLETGMCQSFPSWGREFVNTMRRHRSAQLVCVIAAVMTSRVHKLQIIAHLGI